jgi:hypothetical protein
VCSDSTHAPQPQTLLDAVELVMELMMLSLKYNLIL